MYFDYLLNGCATKNNFLWIFWLGNVQMEFWSRFWMIEIVNCFEILPKKPKLSILRSSDTLFMNEAFFKSKQFDFSKLAYINSQTIHQNLKPIVWKRSKTKQIMKISLKPSQNFHFQNKNQLITISNLRTAIEEMKRHESSTVSSNKTMFARRFRKSMNELWLDRLICFS